MQAEAREEEEEEDDDKEITYNDFDAVLLDVEHVEAAVTIDELRHVRSVDVTDGVLGVLGREAVC